MRHATAAQAAALRSASAAVLAILVPLGLSTKRYHGPGQAWVHANGGDALYAAFWFFFTRLVWPRLSLWKAAVGVLLYCWLIEFSQLLHPPWLERLRRTLPGRLILGSDFEWTDLAFYAVGVALAVALWLAIEASVRHGASRGRK